MQPCASFINGESSALLVKVWWDHGNEITFTLQKLYTQKTGIFQSGHFQFLPIWNNCFVYIQNCQLTLVSLLCKAVDKPIKEADVPNQKQWLQRTSLSWWCLALFQEKCFLPAHPVPTLTLRLPLQSQYNLIPLLAAYGKVNHRHHLQLLKPAKYPPPPTPWIRKGIMHITNRCDQTKAMKYWDPQWILHVIHPLIPLTMVWSNTN